MNKYDEEEGAAAAKPPTPMPSSSSPKEESWSWCTPCRAVVLTCASIVTLAAASSGVFSSNGQDSGGATFDPFDPMTWKLPDWLDNNPHGGNSPFDFNLWGHAGRRCQGLELSVIDNLDEKWVPYFQQAIKDWERGDPDVLSLSVSKASVHDPDCEFVTGSMVVCNGDYGNTDWIGLNQVMIRDDRIIASVALMNDYHLDRMSVEAKQSTMCHELGHGFGLGHWDENFWNRDMGNCMDYTNTHENNQLPDRSNFLFLERMYGSLDGTSQYNSTTEDKGLYCNSADEASSSSSSSQIFKNRFLAKGVVGEAIVTYRRDVPTI